MSLQGDFTDSVSGSAISMVPIWKILKSFALGKVEQGNLECNPKILLARYLANNWTHPIPITELGWDQFFWGGNDIAVKFMEENTTVTGGQTGNNNPDNLMTIFRQPTFFVSYIIIGVVQRSPITTDVIADELDSLEQYIREFIKARPLGLADEGISEMSLDTGYFNIPQQRDKATFKVSISVKMVHGLVTRS